MKIGLLQFSPVWENKEENKNKISNLLKAEAEKPDLLVLPEMTLTGFTMKSNVYAETLSGESVKFYSDTAVKNKCFVIAGLIEKSEGSFYNTAVLINTEGNLVTFYRKIHPFSYSSENKHYSRGTSPVMTEIKNWQTGLSICYDLRFPELYRIYGKQRAGLIINIANWPDTRIHHWKALLKARAIENQCYIAAVNRTGSDPKLNYPGASCIIGPMGEEILTAGNEEAVFTGTILHDHIKEIRTKFPFLEDIHLL